MKSFIRNLCIPGIFILLLFPGPAKAEDQTPPENQLIVYCCPELEDLTSLWVNHYAEGHPDVDMIIRNSEPGTGETSSGTIFLTTAKRMNQSGKFEHFRKITLGRDVIVPVVNKNNPYLQELQKTGLSSEELAGLYTSQNRQHWESFLDRQGSSPVICCLPSDRSCEAYLASFLDSDPDMIVCEHKGNTLQTLSYVAGNKYAVTFCRLADLNNWQDEDREMLSYLPIDNNGDNRIDQFENIYSGTDALVRGIWIGKYPKQLYNRIYAITNENVPEDQEMAFLEWILNDGQQYLVKNGFLDLSYHEAKSERNKLRASIVPLADIDSGSTNFPVILVTGLIILGGGVLLMFLMGRRSSGDEDLYPGEYADNSFTQDKVRVPGGLLYDLSHTWTFMEKDGYVKVGVDDFLPHITGNITRMKMRKSGEVIKKGDILLSMIRNGKQLDIKSPLTGTIKEVNSALRPDPEIINRDPFDAGWIYRIEAPQWTTEMKSFIMANKYRDWLKAEFTRLKDVLVNLLQPAKEEEAKPVFQEGGELRDHVLGELPPSVWEDFQNQFLNRKPLTNIHNT